MDIRYMCLRAYLAPKLAPPSVVIDFRQNIPDLRKFT